MDGTRSRKRKLKNEQGWNKKGYKVTKKLGLEEAKVVYIVTMEM